MKKSQVQQFEGRAGLPVKYNACLHLKYEWQEFMPVAIQMYIVHDISYIWFVNKFCQSKDNLWTSGFKTHTGEISC